jgi:hypothetical protein
MLKDRRVLIESEIEKWKKEAANLYFEIVIKGHTNLNTQYQHSQKVLSGFRNDLQAVNYLIEIEGRE